MNPVQQPTPAPAAASQPTPSPIPIPSPTPVFGAPAPVSPDTRGSKKRSRTLILLGSIIVGIIIAIIIVVVLCLNVFGVSHQDYENAATTANQLSAKITTTNSDLGTLIDDMNNITSSSIASDITTVQGDVKGVAALDTTLSGMKAIKNDSSVNKAFKTYETKMNSFITYANNLTASYKLLQPVIADASAIGNDDSNSDDGNMSAFINDLQKMKTDAAAAVNAPDQDVAAFIKTIQPKIADAIAQAQAADTAYNNDNEDAYDTAYDNLSNAMSAIGTAGDTYGTNASSHLKAVDPTSAYNSFVDVINGKIAKS